MAITIPGPFKKKIIGTNTKSTLWNESKLNKLQVTKFQPKFQFIAT